MALRELLAEFSIDASQAIAGLDRLDKGISNAAGALGGLAEWFIGSQLVHGMREFVEHQIELGSRVNDLAEKLGVGTEELQQFQFAAKLVGVESESAGQALNFLSKNIGEALDGNKEAAETFAKLGISLKDGKGQVRELGDIIPEVADSFEKLESSQERTAVAMKVFGKSGAALIPLLKDGSEGLREAYKDFERLGGGMKKEFIVAADKAGDEIDKLKFGLQNFKSQIVLALLPSITRGAQKMQDWTADLLKFERQTSIAKQAVAIFGVASVAASVKSAAGFAKFLGILPKDASFWKMVLGLGELGLIIAAIALVYLAFEDLFGFLAGKDSLIGEIIDSLFGVGASAEVVEEVKNIFSEFMSEIEAFQPIIDEFGELFGEIWFAAMPYIKDLAKIYLRQIADTLTGIVKLVRWMTSELGAGLQLLGTLAQAGAKFASISGQDEIAAKLGSFGAAFSKTGAGLQKGTTAHVPKTGSTTNVEINQQNRTEVTVEAGDNPRETGRAVAGGVKDGIDDALDDALAASLGGG